MTEPKIPASCVQLPAQLRAVSDKLAEADESKLDTARIQSALDKCKPGMAVELKPASGNNAFLSGPLEMRTGVTLLIDEGVTLFGSRDAAVYEIEGREGATPGLCGTIAAGAPPAVFPAPQRPAPSRRVQAVHQHYGCEGCRHHGRRRHRWAWLREDSGQGL